MDAPTLRRRSPGASSVGAPSLEPAESTAFGSTSDRDWHWEIPRGFGAPDESTATTARRELLEELGGKVAEMIHLGEIATDTGMHSGRDQLYLARLATSSFSGTPGPDALEEGIDAFRAVTPEELRAMLAEGHIHDGFTLAAWSLATARGLLPPAP
ncbi:NUDIX hydrolase [Streptomyces sp. NPDC026673]|uniref:NUDIX hydrolase n=1 Tax=Streptomyces sp. NPDC026673 TaxID=3155724 RepID=UPI0034021323